MTSKDDLSKRLDELEQNDDDSPDTLAEAIRKVYHEKNGT